MTLISEEYSLVEEVHTYLIIYSNKSYNKIKANVWTRKNLKF